MDIRSGSMSNLESVSVLNTGMFSQETELRMGNEIAERRLCQRFACGKAVGKQWM